MNEIETQLTENAEDLVTIYGRIQEMPSCLRGMTAEGLLSIIDMAENGNTAELFALYRDVISSDSQIQSDFAKRKDAVLGDTISLMAMDKTNPLDVVAKDFCSKIVDDAPFNSLIEWLLNATLYPVAVAEKVYAPASSGGFILKQIIKVPFRLLDYTKGEMRIFDVSPTGTVLSTSHPADPARYIIHRGSTMPLPDNWGGPMRALLFWWLLKNMSRQWWADLLERFGAPFLKGKYKDAASKAVLERAFRMAYRLGGIVISKDTEVEIVQAAAGDSSNSHERFITLCNKEISKLIVGQTLSTNSDPTGMGGGASEIQGKVRDDIRKKDARLLGMTIRQQLFTQLCAINVQRGKSPLIIFGSDSTEEMLAMVSLIKSLGEAGFEPDDDGLDNISERVGFRIRRKAKSPSPFPFSAAPLSATQTPEFGALETSAKDLADAFIGRYAPLAAIIKSSTSNADCLKRCRAWLAEQDLSGSADILAEAMSAYAYAGTRRAR